MCVRTVARFPLSEGFFLYVYLFFSHFCFFLCHVMMFQIRIVLPVPGSPIKVIKGLMITYYIEQPNLKSSSRVFKEKKRNQSSQLCEPTYM